MLTDTHAHLFLGTEQFSFENDLPQVLENSKKAQVTTIINVGVDSKTSRLALEQVKSKLFQDSGLIFYSTIGIHPQEAVKFTQNSDESLPAGRHGIHAELGVLEEIYRSDPEKVIAVGECGLDFLVEGNGSEQVKDLQRKLFTTQINLAKKLNLPILVHVRDDRSKNPTNCECWNQAIDLSKDHFGIYHCYSGMPETTQRILKETNFYISFAGNLTYPKNDYLRESLKVIPIERIVLETDCPFLPPQSIRGKRNEPASVKEIAETVAEIKGISFEEVASQTTANVHRLFAF